MVHQIASGLEAIHRANVVHRDLKPENCLFLDVRRDSPLKIMDFGLSSVEEFTDPVVGLFGSIDYVSPEALSQGKITTKSDMWSLGVILYILLSGYVDFFSFFHMFRLCLSPSTHVQLQYIWMPNRESHQSLQDMKIKYGITYNWRQKN